MLGINRKSNQQRRKEDNLKKNVLQNFTFSVPHLQNNKEDAEQEVIEAHGGNAA